jgi:hypothetical protein
MQQIRLAFFAGLASFAVGAGLLFVALRLGQSADDAGRTLHNVLTLSALLVGSGGGFLALCAGSVVLVGLLTRPRLGRRRS